MLNEKIKLAKFPWDCSIGLKIFVLERFGDKNKIENINAVFNEYFFDIDFENINAVKKTIMILLIKYK